MEENGACYTAIPNWWIKEVLKSLQVEYRGLRKSWIRRFFRFGFPGSSLQRWKNVSESLFPEALAGDRVGRADIVE